MNIPQDFMSVGQVEELLEDIYMGVSIIVDKKHYYKMEAQLTAKDELIFAYDATRTPTIDKTIINLRQELSDLKESSVIVEADDDAERLRDFAKLVIRQECWGYDPMDGLSVQDLAEKLGLIVKHTATESDVDEEGGYEAGDIMYKFTERLEAEDRKE